MNLFASMLMPYPEANLRWQGSGPGTNAEIKRAYSALLGRFFGRATLRRDHGCRWLRQVADGLELAPGIYLRRKVGHDGDLPDWVGWDDYQNSWVVAEAKGSHDRSDWIDGNPSPIKTALRQLGRVEIVDSSGPIAFKTWAVASRWGTEENGLSPVVITCDPDGAGRVLEEWELPKCREEARARWVSDLLVGLGRTDLANAIKNEENSIPETAEDDLALVPGRRGYAAVAMEMGGIIPLIGAGREDRAHSIFETGKVLKRNMALVLLGREETERAIERGGQDEASDREVPHRRGWAFAEPDTQKADLPELTVDGLTFRTIMDDIKFPSRGSFD
tara:strand:+ start:637 stop:1635 length:999 start_codon:yes stop_codon:yes gene_type:complete